MGKTTLLEKLVPEIASRGLVVSLIKHSHKNVDIDRPGKDSYRLREAGCKEVLLMGDNRWALMHELRGEPEPKLDYLLSRMQDVDLVLIEGFKEGSFPRFEVWRDSVGSDPLWPTLPGIAAVASDQHLEHVPVPVFDLGAIGAIASFVLQQAQVIEFSSR